MIHPGQWIKRGNAMTKKGLEPGVWIPNAALFIAVACGVLLHREPLRSIRPGAAIDSPATALLDGVKARPWEDPLSVRERSRSVAWNRTPNSLGKNTRISFEEESTERPAQSPPVELGAIQASLLWLRERRSATPQESPLEQAGVSQALHSQVEALTRSPRIASRLEEVRDAAESVAAALPSESGRELTESFFDHLDMKSAIPANTPDLVLIVLVRSGFEPEDIEHRIRARQAIWAAMAQGQYLPERPRAMVPTHYDCGDSKGRGAVFMGEDFVPENMAYRGDGLHITTLPAQTTLPTNAAGKMPDDAREVARYLRAGGTPRAGRRGHRSWKR